ncbi:NAD-dependent succinate-semialdehyde dehydrogenase [Sediminicola luteus]|uniref:Succinate-semialdehyde dehydrogenase (NADP(+)) n=1 Tax=Sediminicola luteus TaxID=319238 RepID=A0A2A4GE37_9FLAO|nr:NAD-dependent succinate-semialdehyde dehydrogenase [Sediminicola luteus]PCE66022.1 succinate-semialdehyde dehydrogenase (NADP(+)) [Sediminicola luteus]
MELKHPELLKTDAYINGEWINAVNDKRFEVTNPYNGEVLAQLADCGAAETELAIEKAEAAFEVWKAQSAGKRAKILRKWYDLIITHANDLALILTLEQGKPLAEAKGEILYGASFVEWFSEEARRVYGDTIPAHMANARITTVKQPIGVVAAITPWNFPNAMITRKVAPALAAGCTVVIKPAAQTPLSALALMQLAQEAGFPPGVVNVVMGTDSRAIGGVMTASKAVRKLSFTGSTAVGKTLMRQSADTVKKLSLELGGNAPFIVFDDADLEKAVEGALLAKYRNAGQTCVCANRIFVQEGIYDAFVNRFSEAVAALPVGNGTEPGTVIGPLINTQAVSEMDAMVQEAVGAGAKTTTGGAKGEGCFYPPTVLAHADKHMRVYKEEIFGPIAPIFKFGTEAEVIALANDTEYGLASYFYGRDYARLWRVAEALEYGMVGINTGAISTTVAPFGGIKESGFGREGSKYGMNEFLEIKYMCWGEIDS